MGVVHQAYENPFPVSIATDRDADAPRCPRKPVVRLSRRGRHGAALLVLAHLLAHTDEVIE
jgi:hypothetical protein